MAREIKFYASAYGNLIVGDGDPTYPKAVTLCSGRAKGRSGCLCLDRVMRKPLETKDLPSGQA